jgi:hypothetical protein
VDRATEDIEREIAEARARLAADLDEFARRLDVRARLRAALPVPALIVPLVVVIAGALVLLGGRRRSRR